MGPPGLPGPPVSMCFNDKIMAYNVKTAIHTAPQIKKSAKCFSNFLRVLYILLTEEGQLEGHGNKFSAVWTRIECHKIQVCMHN